MYIIYILAQLCNFYLVSNNAIFVSQIAMLYHLFCPLMYACVYVCVCLWVCKYLFKIQNCLVNFSACIMVFHCAQHSV